MTKLHKFEKEKIQAIQYNKYVRKLHTIFIKSKVIKTKLIVHIDGKNPQNKQKNNTGGPMMGLGAGACYTECWQMWCVMNQFFSCFLNWL